MTRSYNGSIKCEFCNSTKHRTRYCPIEKKISPLIRSKVGKMMENVASKLSCPRCNQRTLNVLGNDSPSLDIICSHCKSNFEVKSKCLSVENELPLDIKLNAGNYNEWEKRQKSGLDFIVIIYRVDRKEKNLAVRKIFYVPHHRINNDDNFFVQKKSNSRLSNIFIKDHTVYNCINNISKYHYSLYDFIWKLINREKIDY